MSAMQRAVSLVIRVIVVNGGAMDPVGIFKAIRDTGWNEFSGSELGFYISCPTTRAAGDMEFCKQQAIYWEQISY